MLGSITHAVCVHGWAGMQRLDGVHNAIDVPWVALQQRCEGHELRCCASFLDIRLAQNEHDHRLPDWKLHFSVELEDIPRRMA